MKLICLDKTAADRLRLHKFIEEAFTSCRDTVGHLTHLDIVPMGREELLLSGPGTAALLVGWGYPFEEAVTLCSELHAVFPGRALLVFVRPDAISLRTLRRFERFSAEVFSFEDRATRIVHALLRSTNSQKRERAGKLITFDGVKGGVGVTSLVGGLAHAAESLALRSIVHDLSLSASLSQYLAAPRWHSTDYRVLLTDRLAPSKLLVERCIAHCPNGIVLLLPPSGGAEIRDCWIRESDSLDITLAIFDLLSEMYDLIFVDLARAEGLLPFALQARADVRVLVSSNDPASVHLLSDKLNELEVLAFQGRTEVVLNLLQERSLSERDIRNFLRHADTTHERRISLRPLKSERRAAAWIGTGNTLYTEGSAQIQLGLERFLLGVLGNTIQPAFAQQHRPMLPPLRWPWLRRNRQIQRPPVRSLPEPVERAASDNGGRFVPDFILGEERSQLSANDREQSGWKRRAVSAAGGSTGVFGS